MTAPTPPTAEQLAARLIGALEDALRYWADVMNDDSQPATARRRAHERANGLHEALHIIRTTTTKETPDA